MTNKYSEVDIPVTGGDLHVGVWEPENGYTDTVIAIHGVTSSHMAWPLVAQHLSGVRVIAPDLRGRGRSNKLSEPLGMIQHTVDMKAIVDYFDLGSVTFVGHSMGAFVSMFTAYQFPEIVKSLILIDGGIPIYVPGNLEGEELITAVIGPAMERLAMEFDSVDQYVDFWKLHPAFQGDWNDTVTGYIKYDLDLLPNGKYRACTTYESVLADSIDLNASKLAISALSEIKQSGYFFRAEFGLLGSNPPLYEEDYALEQLKLVPSIEYVNMPGVNHYTIIMADEGASVIADYIKKTLAK
ncbi:MAG: alpha/beta hydrolase [Microbacteriaceae bacterium]|nr:alpha/beta hydrolase [Microbacteriaceae bacterium]